MDPRQTPSLPPQGGQPGVPNQNIPERPLAVPARPATPAPTPQPTPPAPMPADVLPPRQVPPVPTLNPQQPTQIGARPVQAATPQSTAATYTPPSLAHVPDDIAARLAETPMQNSSEVAKKIQHGANGSRLKTIATVIVFIASVFVAAFLINQFVFESYYVDGTSMTPTLQNNDRLIVSKVEKTWANIQGKPYIPDRGQIVVLDSSIVGLDGQKEQLIKRVIGLPGDHIHIENGAVTITNSQHPSGYDVTQALGLTNLQATYSDAPIDLTVPPTQVYVMGDNRAQGGSYDSRAFGPIDGDKIEGRLWARVLPLDKAQLF